MPLLISMRTTITIPDLLAIEVDALVGTDGINSRNQLIVMALQNFVELKGEDKIDAKFASMAEDSDYIAETLAIENEFSFSDSDIPSLSDD